MKGNCVRCRRRADLNFARDAAGSVWALCEDCAPPRPDDGLDGCRGLAALLLFGAAVVLGFLVGWLVRGV